MTSSLALKKRREQRNIWTFGNPETSTLGGWEDHYITPGHTHPCHPDYTEISIGNPYGFSVCVRRERRERKCNEPNAENGYYRYRTNLYDVSKEKPNQLYDPYRYSDRRTQNEPLLIRTDYLHLPIKFNGTGITPIHTPTDSTVPYPPGYFEYGYSSETCPPPEYDITRGIQPYPVWKAMQEYNTNKVATKRQLGVYTNV